MPVPRRIVVTGVSRGLGRALADGFIARDNAAFGCAQSKAAIAELRLCYPSPNGFAVVDVGRDDEVQAWAEKAVPFLLSLGPKDNAKPMEVPE